mgnify:CR=1 FL=1
MMDLYVVVSLVPGIAGAPMHVYGGPWRNLGNAERAARHIDALYREKYPNRQRVQFLVRKIIVDPAEEM